MLTIDVKKKIDDLWALFWSNGLTNPIEIIEQINFLIFLKKIKENKIELKGESDVIKWDDLINVKDKKKFELIKNSSLDYYNKIEKNRKNISNHKFKFFIFKIPNINALKNSISLINEIFDFSSELPDNDLKGDVYEYLLSKLSLSGINGQFRTPQHIIDLIVKMINPKSKEKVVDPACGTGGFLTTTLRHLKTSSEKIINSNEVHIEGFDSDLTMLDISRMNLILNKILDPKLKYVNSLTSENKSRDEYDVIFANPPFSGTQDLDIISRDLIGKYKTKRSELLFLNLINKMLKTGGRAGVIIPEGVLFNSAKPHQSIRKDLLEKYDLKAVISLPSGVFKPYSKISTSIIIFSKNINKLNNKIWFYEVRKDGFSLDNKRKKISLNDIPDLLKRWENLTKEIGRSEYHQSFFIEKNIIKKNNYILSLKEYKKIKYEKKEVKSSVELFSEIVNIEENILEEMKKLKIDLGEESEI